MSSNRGADRHRCSPAIADVEKLSRDQPYLLNPVMAVTFIFDKTNSSYLTNLNSCNALQHPLLSP